MRKLTISISTTIELMPRTVAHNNFKARLVGSPFVLKHTTSLYIRVDVALVQWSIPLQTSLKRILWFINLYPYYPIELFNALKPLLWVQFKLINLLELFFIRLSGGGKLMYYWS